MVDAEQPILDQLWVIIDNSLSLADIEQRRAGLESAIERLSAMTSGDSPNGRIWYMLGYAYYSHPDQHTDENIQYHTVACLNNATSTGSQLAHLYLGHYYYDRGEFYMSLSALTKGDRDNVSRYMSLKWEELELCCHILLYGMQHSLAKLRSFVQYASQCCSDDISPFNLHRALEERARTTTTVPDDVVEQLTELDRLIGGDDWFVEIIRDVRKQ